MSQLEEIEKILVSGPIGDTRNKLRTLSATKLKRSDRAQYAQLCIRAGLITRALQALHPAVRPEGRRKTTEATPEELVEYGGALIYAGALDEGAKILTSLDSTKLPRADLYLAFGEMFAWNYEHAVPRLTRYISAASTSEYAKLVAQVNLAAGLIFVRRLPEAEECLNLVREKTKNGERAKLLEPGILELSAQCSLFCGNFDQAEKYLASASNVLSSRNDNLTLKLYIQKWEAILALERNRGNSGALNRLVRLRNFAFENGQWETARDCDARASLYRNSRSGLRRVYFGTPFEKYRDRLMQTANELFENFSIPDSYRFRLFTRKLIGVKTVGSVDLATGEIIVSKNSFSHSRLKNGSNGLRALRAITRDFYRPIRLAEIWASVFPDRFFHPLHSPAVLHQLIRRLRAELVDRNTPLQIVESGGTYRLQANAPFMLILSKTENRVNLASVDSKFIKDTKTLVGLKHSFSASDLAAALDIPLRTVKRKLAHAISAGKISPVGKGPSSRYIFR